MRQIFSGIRNDTSAISISYKSVTSCISVNCLLFIGAYVCRDTDDIIGLPNCDCLIPDGLKNLTLGLPSDQVAGFLHVSCLTALTSLFLNSLGGWTDAQTLCQLPLQELGLIHCNYLELDLLVPNALQSLKTLSIQDGYSQGSSCLVNADRMEDFKMNYQDRLRQAASVVRGLPNLQMLEGNCSLYRVGWHAEPFELNLRLTRMSQKK